MCVSRIALLHGKTKGSDFTELLHMGQAFERESHTLVYLGAQVDHLANPLQYTAYMPARRHTYTQTYTYSHSGALGELSSVQFDLRKRPSGESWRQQVHWSMCVCVRVRVCVCVRVVRAALRDCVHLYVSVCACT